MSEKKENVDPKELIKLKWKNAMEYENSAYLLKSQVIGIAESIGMNANELNTFLGVTVFSDKKQEEK